MKKITIILFAGAVVLLSSCQSSPKMYKWHGYEDAAYAQLKKTNDKSLEKLLETYEEIIADQEGTLRETIPPGVCADYGYFLIQAGKVEEGIVLLDKEVELYPESKKLIDAIKEVVNEK